MARNRNSSSPKPADKPVTKARQKQLDIAAINAQVMSGDITAEDAQAQIDELNGIVREVDDQTGNVTVMDANLTDSPPSE